MKRLILFFVSAIFLLTSIKAQTKQEAYNAYIEKYYKQAQAEQKKYGIPASITLAQGLLESAAGKSDLALKANNHFGVKCAGDWKGATFTKDDDAKDECFRKYKHVSDSYEDHSKFLLRDRYAPLFKLESTDYKGWAHGLKQCGYATDPGYAGKLIKLIEDYDLTRYDVAKQPEDNTPTAATPSKSNSKIVNEEIQNDSEPEDIVESSFKTKKTRPKLSAVDLVNEHKVLRNNGNRYIVARQGDTFASLAYEYNMYEKTLRRYNDIVNPQYELHKGDKVYLYKKRTRAKKQYAVYRVKQGENIWQIAQDKGVTLKSIYKRNGIEEGQNVTVNQELRLR